VPCLAHSCDHSDDDSGLPLGDSSLGQYSCSCSITAATTMALSSLPYVVLQHCGQAWPLLVSLVYCGHRPCSVRLWRCQSVGREEQQRGEVGAARTYDVTDAAW